MPTTRSDVSRTIVVEATEEYAPVDCYEVCAVTTTTMHYGAVGDGTLGAHGDGRQQGTSKRLCLALACRSSIVKQGLPDLVRVHEVPVEKADNKAPAEDVPSSSLQEQPGWTHHSGNFKYRSNLYDHGTLQYIAFT